MPTRPRLRRAATGGAALAGWLLCAHAAWSAPTYGEAPAAGSSSVGGEREAPGSLGADPTGFDSEIALASMRVAVPGASRRAILRLSLRGPRYSGLLLASPASWGGASLSGVDLSDPRAVLELIAGDAAVRTLLAMRR